MERFDATIVEALGGQGRIPVRVTFDGLPYQGSLVSMGDTAVVGVLKSIRAQLGKGPGDVVAVTLEVDRTIRSIAVPADLRAALDVAGLADRFAGLSYSHQREHVTWIDDAKKPGTRARRIGETIDRLRP